MWSSAIHISKFHVSFESKVIQKLEERWIGPFQITQAQVNGNVTIRRRPGIVERIITLEELNHTVNDSHTMTIVEEKSATSP